RRASDGTGASSSPTCSAGSNPDASSTIQRASAAAASPDAGVRRACTSRRNVRQDGQSSRTSARSRSIGFPELAAALVGGERVDDLVELLLPGEDLLERVQRHPDPVVGDPVLLEVVGADLLGPAAALHLAAPGRRELRLLALALDLQQPRPEDAQRLVLVL